jgi:hypothetical protein
VGRGFAVARAAGRRILIRPDGYVCAELDALAPVVLERAVARELGAE